MVQTNKQLKDKAASDATFQAVHTDRDPNKPSPEPETKTGFQGWWADLEGYTFDLGPRASDKFSRTMKEMEQYLGTTYSDSCKTAIMTKTTATFPDPDMPNITYLGTDIPETD